MSQSTHKMKLTFVLALVVVAVGGHPIEFDTGSCKLYAQCGSGECR